MISKAGLCGCARIEATNFCVTGAAVNEKEMRDVQKRFWEYVGKVTSYYAFLAQFDKTC
jgi:hypothetical protein